jgi:hypothetical protein
LPYLKNDLVWKRGEDEPKTDVNKYWKIVTVKCQKREIKRIKFNEFIIDCFRFWLDELVQKVVKIEDG